MSRSERPNRGTIVYVGGLEPSVKKEEIEKEFEQFGKLTRVWVAFNPPGFAFVEYENQDDAEKAVSALHSATRFGSRLRVEVSRGRGRGRGGSRGGFSSRGGGFGGGRGGRGRGDFGRDFRGGRGRGGFGGGRPYDRDDYFRGDEMRGRYGDFADRRRSEYGARDFGERDFGGARDFRDIDGPRGFGGRDFPVRDAGARDFGSRGLGGSGYASRDLERGFPDESAPERDFGAGRDMRGGREFGGRDYGVERPVNGAARGYNGDMDRGFGGRDFAEERDFGSGPPLANRSFGNVTSPPAREAGGRGFMEPSGFGAGRDIGMRRDDFNSPKDMGLGGRPSRIDYADDDRFGAGGRASFGDTRAAGLGYAGTRFAGGDGAGPGDYGGFGGARDRFRSRSPIGRVSRPLY